jgi:hypothetical protein
LLRSWWLALDAEVVQLHRTEVVAGPALAAVEQAMADTADPDHTLGVWKDIADIAVTGPMVAKDSRVAELDEFIRPWGPRALGELYRADDAVAIADLVDALHDEYHGPAASEMLAKMTGVAVRTGLQAATEAGMAIVQVPTDVDIDPDISSLVDGSGGILGAPAWAVTTIEGASVELTPLGRYAVRLNLLAEGTHAPLLEPAP